MDASKDQQNEIDILEARHYTVSAWLQVTHQILEYCFRKSVYGHGQPSDVSDIAMWNEDDNDAFRAGKSSVAWIMRLLTTCLWTVTW
jgi:hypothetical protein